MLDWWVIRNWEYAMRYFRAPDPWKSAPKWAVELFDAQRHMHNRMEKMMATLDQVLADVAEEATAIDGLVVFIAGLKKQIDDLKLGLSPEEQAKVDAIFAGIEMNKGKVVAALEPKVEEPPAE